ncbi:MAG: 2Fe-2S iron-sulfur cluster binding domain-containing protein [Bryobacterales bacterium]|nr:2Fe-2S iron-sulfur cluster binding domain-containing protein [Bryobacterales bacterium]
MSSTKKPDHELQPATSSGVSRRGFLGTASATAGAVGSGLLEQSAQAAPPAGVMGPGETEITLTINGKATKVKVETRTTLLDACRERLEITGAKRVCDRGTCGACTMIVNGKTVYGCTTLAVDNVGKKIETIENLTAGAKPHPIVPAFSNNDALQCGYCTPGMVMASKGLLDRTPNPTYDQVKAGLGGNLCRCGTYVGIRKAVLEAAKELRASGGRTSGGSNA